jgi:hypothetical protein
MTPGTRREASHDTRMSAHSDGAAPLKKEPIEFV